MRRTILKQEVKNELLGSQVKLAQLAEYRGIQVQNAMLLIKKDSPRLSEIDTLDAIKDIIDFKGDIRDMVEWEEVGDKELQHE